MTQLEVLRLLKVLLKNCDYGMDDGGEYHDSSKVVNHTALTENLEEAILEQYAEAGFDNRRDFQQHLMFCPE